MSADPGWTFADERCPYPPGCDLPWRTHVHNIRGPGDRFHVACRDCKMPLDGLRLCAAGRATCEAGLPIDEKKHAREPRCAAANPPAPVLEGQQK